MFFCMSVSSRTIDTDFCAYKYMQQANMLINFHEWMGGLDMHMDFPAHLKLWKMAAHVIQQIV